MTFIVITISAILVLLKAGFKLYIGQRPTGLDQVRAVLVLPCDVLFLVIGLIIKHYQDHSSDSSTALCAVLTYVLVALTTTWLWRLSDDWAKAGRWFAMGLTFSINAAISATSLYAAFKVFV